MAGVDPHPHGPPDEVYCDESLDRGGYDLIGGLWFTGPSARRLRKILARLREEHGYSYEFKWTKPSGERLPSVYRALAKALTDQVVSGRARFHCIAMERRLIDYRTFHEGDRELGYYKFMELLLRKRVQPGRTYLVYVDRRTTRLSDRLSTLRRVLNRTARRECGIAYDCCRSVEARAAKDDDLLQVSDLLLGAVGWHYARRHLHPDSSQAKNELADLIARGIGKPHLCLDSPPSERCFNVWRWRPKAEGK